MNPHPSAEALAVFAVQLRDVRVPFPLGELIDPAGGPPRMSIADELFAPSFPLTAVRACTEIPTAPYQQDFR